MEAKLMQNIHFNKIMSKNSYKIRSKEDRLPACQQCQTQIQSKEDRLPACQNRQNQRNIENVTIKLTPVFSCYS